METTYWNEHLDNELLNGLVKQQAIENCRPGYFLRGIQVWQGTYINKVHAIICENYEQTEMYTNILEPENQIGSLIEGSFVSIDCETSTPILPGQTSNGQSWVTGMRVRSGAWTDSIQFLCQNK